MSSKHSQKLKQRWATDLGYRDSQTRRFNETRTARGFEAKREKGLRDYHREHAEEHSAKSKAAWGEPGSPKRKSRSEAIRRGRARSRRLGQELLQKIQSTRAALAGASAQDSAALGRELQHLLAHLERNGWYRASKKMQGHWADEKWAHDLNEKRKNAGAWAPQVNARRGATN